MATERKDIKKPVCEIDLAAYKLWYEKMLRQSFRLTELERFVFAVPGIPDEEVEFDSCDFGIRGTIPSRFLTLRPDIDGSKMRRESLDRIHAENKVASARNDDLLVAGGMIQEAADERGMTAVELVTLLLKGDAS